MKRLLMLLCLLFLLTGCQTAPQPPTQPPTLPPEQTGVPLLDQGIGSGNLVYIPNPHVESMVCPEIRLYGNSLLLYEHTEEALLCVKRISLEDGRLLAEAAFPMSSSATIQMGNGRIGLNDSETGQVLILNEWLEPQATYSIPLEGENWCLSADLETLFVFCPQEGLLSWNLETEQTQWILSAVTQPLGTGNGYALVSYTDPADQTTCNRSLNLSTAILETFPVEGRFLSGSRSGEQWLLRQSSGEYILVNGDSAGAFSWPEGRVELMPGRRQLLMTDENSRNLYLYDLSGKFLSHCALSKTQPASVGPDLIWSGYWQGYFFRDTYDNAAHLMFWDISTPGEGEPLSISPIENVQAPQPVMVQALYHRAAVLSDRFGVDIRIAEQCALEYSHYGCNILADPYFVQLALDTLETALSGYPENFFRQLSYGDVEQIRIELVASLQAKDGIDTHPTSVGGFTQTMSDHYLMVLDGLFLTAETVYHEFSHIIDTRLRWDALEREDALFSEETWLSLQPATFRYAGSYTDLAAELSAFENSGYFVSSYAMTFPTEDRATLMALAMTEPTALTPAMRDKMRYYAACIRDCFDTTGWPANTLWEPTP